MCMYIHSVATVPWTVVYEDMAKAATSFPIKTATPVLRHWNQGYRSLIEPGPTGTRSLEPGACLLPCGRVSSGLGLRVRRGLLASKLYCIVIVPKLGLVSL